MVKDAEINAAEDKKRREAVDAKNHADALVHSTEKALAEHGSKVEETERRAIEDALSDLREALKGDDAEAIKTKTNTLAQASMKLGEAMYKQQAEADAGQGCREGRRRRRRIHRSRRRQEHQEVRVTSGRLVMLLERNIVTPGLDPGVHLSKPMDGRAKPGHDN